MSFLYFAYGSNLWPPRLRSRCSSARIVTRADLRGWEAVYDKPGADGSAKMNLRVTPDAAARGVLYELDDDDRPGLDRAEPGYTPFVVTVTREDGVAMDALTYRWTRAGTGALPVDWYVALVVRGARHHRLSETYVREVLEIDAAPDPHAPGIGPAGEGHSR